MMEQSNRRNVLIRRKNFVPAMWYEIFRGNNSEPGTVEAG